MWYKCGGGRLDKFFSFYLFFWYCVVMDFDIKMYILYFCFIVWRKVIYYVWVIYLCLLYRENYIFLVVKWKR